MAEQRKLRFGIVGMTSDHVWGMGDAALPEVELIAGAEPYPELRERATHQWGLDRTYEDYETMLDREEVDPILVCTDNASKADVAEAATRRGVHVYQDKPMAATLAQADRILRAAESSGVTLMVHSAFNPIYAEIKRLLAAGAIGKVYLARGVTGHGGGLINGPMGTELHSTATPAVPEGWEPIEVPGRPGGGRAPAAIKSGREEAR